MQPSFNLWSTPVAAVANTGEVGAQSRLAFLVVDQADANGSREYNLVSLHEGRAWHKIEPSRA